MRAVTDRRAGRGLLGGAAGQHRPGRWLPIPAVTAAEPGGSVQPVPGRPGAHDHRPGVRTGLRVDDADQITGLGSPEGVEALRELLQSSGGSRPDRPAHIGVGAVPDAAERRDLVALDRQRDELGVLRVRADRPQRDRSHPRGVGTGGVQSGQPRFTGVDGPPADPQRRPVRRQRSGPEILRQLDREPAGQFTRLRTGVPDRRRAGRKQARGQRGEQDTEGQHPQPPLPPHDSTLGRWLALQLTLDGVPGLLPSGKTQRPILIRVAATGPELVVNMAPDANKFGIVP